MYTLEEKIRLIEESNSMLDLNEDILPKAFKEDYYFISYSHKDYKKVMKDILLLEDKGVNVWYDSDMHIGENWEDIAETYISKYQCKGIIFYLSQNSILSKACNKEVNYVLENNKQFFSINIPLEGEEVSSGLKMLLTLKNRGHEIGEELIASFEKAFSDKLLYLSYEDSIQRKKEQIEKLVGEDLFVFNYEYSNYREFCDCSNLVECRDNSLIKLDFKKNYQINKSGSQNFGKFLPLRFLDKCVFANSFKLQSVTLPENMLEIKEFAFANCLKLKKINLDIQSLYFIDSYAFTNCKNLNVDKITCLFLKDHVFAECDSLKEITLTTNQIGDFCFENCSGLTTVNLVTPFGEWGKYAFLKCKELKQITVGGNKANLIKGTNAESAIRIKSSCFQECESLENISFAGNVDLSEAYGIFERCTNLKEVTFKLPKLREIKDYFFQGCENLKAVYGLEKVKKYNYNSFYNCYALQELDLSNATEICEQAFAYAGLKEVNLSKVKKIGRNAFAIMDNLTKITIGEKLTELESDAFYDCPNVKELTVLSKDFCFDYDSFSGIYPEVITVCNYDFLNTLLENNYENLKTVYATAGIINEDNISDLYAPLKAVESDKVGFDKFFIDNDNPYLKFVDKRIILHLKTDERIYTYCEEAGYDEERGEYYLVAGNRYYESEIEDVSKDFYY